MMKEIIMTYLNKVDIMKTLVGSVILLIFLMLVLSLTNHEMPEGNREIIIHVLGIIEGAVMMIVGFYYGSSKGSQAKDETIKNQSEQK